MPIDTVTIRRIFPMPVRKGLTQYVVWAWKEGQSDTSFQTLNGWLASLCERAKAKERPAKVTWKDSPYGQTIVAVEVL